MVKKPPKNNTKRKNELTQKKGPTSESPYHVFIEEKMTNKTHIRK